MEEGKTFFIVSTRQKLTIHGGVVSLQDAQKMANGKSGSIAIEPGEGGRSAARPVFMED